MRWFILLSLLSSCSGDGASAPGDGGDRPPPGSLPGTCLQQRCSVARDCLAWQGCAAIRILEPPCPPADAICFEARACPSDNLWCEGGLCTVARPDAPACRLPGGPLPCDRCGGESCPDGTACDGRCCVVR